LLPATRVSLTTLARTDLTAGKKKSAVKTVLENLAYIANFALLAIQTARNF
jgi:hypothetical protein